MEKLIPIFLIFSFLTVLNPAPKNQLYLIDISAIEITDAGAERFVPDAGISLIDPASGKEIRPYKVTPQASSYSFIAQSGNTTCRVEVNNKQYKAVNGRVIDLSKVKKYTWKQVYLEKTPENLLKTSVDNPGVM
jgi:hypothetical protein